MSGRVTVPAFPPAWIEGKMDVLFITNLFIYIMVESDLGKAEYDIGLDFLLEIITPPALLCCTLHFAYLSTLMRNLILPNPMTNINGQEGKLDTRAPSTISCQNGGRGVDPFQHLYSREQSHGHIHIALGVNLFQCSTFLQYKMVAS